MYLRVTSLRRFAIYLIDIGLISIVSSLLMLLVLKISNYDTDRYNNLYDIIIKAYTDYYTGKNNDLMSTEMANNLYEFLGLYAIREGIRYAFAFVLIIVYLVIFPHIFKWQTLGRLITRSMIISEKGDIQVSTKQLIIRECVGTFLFYIFFGGIIGIISAILAIVTEKSLVDRISKTVMVLDTKVIIEENPYNYNGNNFRDNYDDNQNEYNNDFVEEVKEEDTDQNIDTDDEDEYKVI